MDNNDITVDVSQEVKEIKQSLRQLMDGVTAQSMRQKGMEYKLNWGASLSHLRMMANDISATFPEVYGLAIALWKEDVRECKILATMLMPPDKLLPEVADIWMEQTPTVEIAEQAAYNLYQHLPYASDAAFRWIASTSDLSQICGYHVLSRLFSHRQEPNERGASEFIDQALTALQSSNAILQKAAMQSVIHFASMGLLYERLAHSAVRTINLDFI